MDQDKPVLITNLVKAYDTVIPGYAWAWHDVNLAEYNARARPYSRRKGWRDARRKYVTLSERCITLYGFWPDKDSSPDAPSLIAYNRGYVQLFGCTFPDPQRAISDLYTFRDRGTWDPDQGKYYVTKDGTAFDTRCHVTINVLQYVKAHATMITPLWQTEDLTRSS